MIIPLIDLSALEYWLDGVEKYYYPSPVNVSLKPNFEFSINGEIASWIAKDYNLLFPVQFMVPKNKKRRTTSKYKLFAYRKTFPKGSFVRLNDRRDLEVYVACPELCFVYAVNNFELSVAVKIGCLLCAMFVLEYSGDEIHQRQRTPVTSVKKITDFIERAKGLKGIEKSKYAVQFVTDNCNSIQEVNLAVIKKLPVSKGGYGLKEFLANGKIALKQNAATFLGRNSCMCDFVWKKEKIVVEYESDMFHLDSRQHTYDKRRSTAIVLSGFKIINITKYDTKSISNLDSKMFALRHALKMKKRTKEFEKFFDIRRKVFKTVFFYDFLGH